MKTRTILALALVLVMALAFAGLRMPAVAAVAGGGCPSINGIGGKLQSSIVGATFTLDDTYTTATYVFDSLLDRSPSGGVPGLIEYCVYPDQPPGNPASAVALAVGDNGDPFETVFKAVQGYFAFGRGDGNPSNIGLDGTAGIQMGTATWNIGAAPTTQTILLHINDPVECRTLYGGDDDTCFVYPLDVYPPPPPTCNGEPACKEVVIDEAITDTPLTVPAFTLLHIHYLYVIVNQPTNDFDMIFRPPTDKTKDVNSGGAKDYFGCEQIPDMAGQPGKAGTYLDYQDTGFTLKLTIPKPGARCEQSRFFFTAPPGPAIVLHPGEWLSFTADMITRTNRGGKQEFTSTGLHYLNSGFTVKWFQSNDVLLHSFTTNTLPVYVNAVP